MQHNWQAGNVDVVIVAWNEAYLSQLESFPESKFKDMVDASANGFNEIYSGNTTIIPPLDMADKDKISFWNL